MDMQSVITLTRMPQDIFSFTKAQMGTGNTGTYVLANNTSTSGPADTCASTSTSTCAGTGTRSSRTSADATYG